DTLMLGRHLEAINYYKRACKLAEDLNDPRQRGLAYWGLGLAYKSSGDLFRSETAFHDSLKIFERLNDIGLASQLHTMLGEVLIELKDYEKAERHLRLALDYAERNNEDYARGGPLGNLAILLIRQGKIDEAITAAQEGIRLLHQIESYRI